MKVDLSYSRKKSIFNILPEEEGLRCWVDFWSYAFISDRSLKRKIVHVVYDIEIMLQASIRFKTTINQFGVTTGKIMIAKCRFQFHRSWMLLYLLRHGTNISKSSNLNNCWTNTNFWTEIGWERYSSRFFIGIFKSLVRHASYIC